jgi:hypothetical protein
MNKRFCPANFTAQDHELVSQLENKLRDIITKDRDTLGGKIVFAALITLLAEILKLFPRPEAERALENLPNLIRRINYHADQEEEFLRKVMKQLPGMPEPRIMVQAPGTFRTVSIEQDAESAAQHFQEPVAIVSPDGRVLAYRVPRQGGLA